MDQENHSRDKEDFLQFNKQYGNLQLLLITVVVLMLFLSLTAVVGQIYISRSWRILPFILILVTMEGAWTTRWLARAHRRINRPVYRVAEVITIIVIVLLTYWLSVGEHGRKNLFDNFFEHPLSIVNIQNLVLILLCLLAWWWSNHLSGIFSRLALSKDEIEYFTTPSAERIERGIAPVIPVFRDQLLSNYLQSWAVGGLIIATLTMLSTFELTDNNLTAIQNFDFRNVTRLGLRSDMLFSLLIYFAAGFWLASHGRLAVMRARWIAGGLEIEPAIIKRWRRQVIVIIAIVALLAAFLPIGSTLAISRILEGLLAYLFTFGVFLLSVIPFLIAWLLSLISSETPLQEQALELPSRLPVEKVPETNLEIPSNGFEWMLLSMAIIVSFMAITYFFKQRSLKFDFPRFSDGWNHFIARIRFFWHRLRRMSTEVTQAVRIPFRRPKKINRKSKAWPFFPNRPQTPREQIRYLYLSILLRAEKLGVGREPGQTPLQYENELRTHWPEASDEIQELTGKFLMARYSQQPINDQSAAQAKKVYKRLRTTIRRGLNANSLQDEQ